MRRLFYLFIAVLLTGELFARAGGGGSYRSSGSSSSSRSSGSSSRSSGSSSSSYRSSSGSSGSSYRPSGSSGSSSYRPSSSGSSSYSTPSTPSYASLLSAPQVVRTYDFRRAGYLEVTEVFKLPPSSRKTGKYRHQIDTPDVPATLVTAQHEMPKYRNFSNTGNDFFFELKPDTKEDSYTLGGTFKISAIPAIQGAFVDLSSPCADRQDCTVNLLMPNGSVDVIGKKAKGGSGRLLLQKSGPVITLSREELSRSAFVRIYLDGEEPRLAAAASWSNAPLQADISSLIQVDSDGTVHATASIEYLKRNESPIAAALMQGPAWQEKENRITNTINIHQVNLHSYGVESFKFQGFPTEYGYAAWNLTGSDMAAGKIVLPIAAPNSGEYTMTQRQYATNYIAWQKKIVLRPATNQRFKISLAECRHLGSEGCQSTYPVRYKEERRGDEILLTPLEAQVTGLWLLQLELTEGKFEPRGFWKRLVFDFGHYHTVGKYPRWVARLYVFSVIGGLVLLIFVITRLRRRKYARMEKKKISQREDDTLRDLLQRDPAFRADAFRQRCREIAAKIQHAWAAGDMRECRRYLSQGVYNRFRIQLKIMRELEKRQNAMADFNILGLHIFARQRSGPYDALIVRLEAEARDIMVDVSLSAAAAHAAAEKAPLNRFVEFYTFMRRRDAKTQNVATIDACSRCGTPFAAEGEITKCKNCGAVMGSGVFDWVLAEITQEVEYGKAKRFKLPSKEISPDRIEDRASFLFWRDTMARISGKKDFVLRDATDRYLQQSFTASGLKDIAVGAADLEQYDDALSPISATVRIKWSAQAPGDREVRHRQSVLRLTAAPQDEEGSGFADHSCGNCGAPLPETDSESCSYCRSPIQAKNKDWLIDEISTTVE